MAGTALKWRESVRKFSEQVAIIAFVVEMGQDMLKKAGS